MVNFLTNRVTRFILALLVFLVLPGCSLQLVSDYDQKSMTMMEGIAKDVDRLYIQLGYEKPLGRNFSIYSAFYEDVEVDLNALKSRQEVRPMNELTLKQVDVALQLWSQDRMAHQRKNTVSDFLVRSHRRQFKRLFHAMIKGESSKPKGEEQ